LPASLNSVSSSTGGGNMRIFFFDYVLSETEYSNLEDRVARNLMPVESGLTELSNDFELVQTSYNELTSPGHDLVSQDFKLEAAYESDAVNYNTHSFDDGNYSATHIIENLGFSYHELHA